MTELAKMPLEIVNAAGETIATISLEVPLRLPLRPAMELIAKLCGESLPEAAAAPVDQMQPVCSLEDARAQAAAETRRNLEARADAYDEEGLRAWLRTLDPANPHMSVAYDIVSARLADLEQADVPGGQPVAPAVQHLVEEARRLEESYRADLELAESGDDAARLRAQETRSRIVSLQEDIRDGVDRQEEGT